VESFRSKYAARAEAKPLVGISWHSANPMAQASKSMALADLAPLLRNIDATFVSLQYGNHESELKAFAKNFGIHVVHDGTVDPLSDMDSFVAQVAAMDRVLTVSNTTAHVAGALGTPCWTMVPASYGRLWYWFLETASSPWYASMVLSRVRHGETWPDFAIRTLPRALSWLKSS
ncbi:MAG: hypothetical protein KDE14_09000, partial [Rhodobacteraceae bacterium]|nr:hypothetical protein [Paracoccaceae bacterium]